VLVLRADAPVDALAEHRVATVVADPSQTETARRVGAAVAAPVVRRELASDPVGTLEELADLHRGETLLVVAEDEVADALLVRLLGRTTAHGLADESLVELAVDGDGWSLRPVNT
jgi:hypothetical protein